MSNICKDDALRLLPNVLQNDEQMAMLAEAMASDISTELGLCNEAAIYSRIDELPEELLDILAVDLNVEWYEFDADLTTKRNQITTSWEIHRKLGTAGCLRTVLDTVWDDSDVQEWFEYSGSPYHFRVVVSDTYSAENDLRVMKLINSVKSARSVLDSIVYNGAKSAAQNYVFSAPSSISVEIQSVTL